MTQSASGPAAPVAEPVAQHHVHPLVAKARQVVERQDRLTDQLRRTEDDLNRAEVDLALTRARLTLALDLSLIHI